MRKLALTIVSAVAFTTAAHAEPFSGPYVGAEITHDSFELDSDDIDLGGGATASIDSLNGNGVGLGLYAGYDYLVSESFFVGGELNLNFSDAEMKLGFDDGVDTQQARFQAKESYGISGRAGYKINNSTAIYGRLGWVDTKFKESQSVNGIKVFGDKHTNDGFLYGAGLQSFIGDNASIRVEYTATDYGHFEDGAAGVTNNKVSAGFGWNF